MVTRKYDQYFRAYAGIWFADLVPWTWFRAQAIAESGLDPQAMSPAGAMGIMQLMPGTAFDMQRELGLINDPFNPNLNIMMGIRYDRRCWDIWKQETGIERIRFMLASYNAGPGNIIQAQRLAKVKDHWDAVAANLALVTGAHARETIDYVAKVERLHAQGA